MNLNRDDAVVFLRAALIALFVTFGGAALAGDLLCPPKHYFCWQAKIIFKKYGASAVVARTKACGWTRDEIAEAKKCL